MITVRIDTSKAERMLADLPDVLARARLKAMASIGAAVVSRTTLAFRTPNVRPSPWAPRKDKKATHPLLIKSGALRQSFSWRLEAPNTVVVGTPHKYANYHQYGTKNMPARPFFPVDKYGSLTPDMARKIDQIIGKAYSEALKG